MQCMCFFQNVQQQPNQPFSVHQCWQCTIKLKHINSTSIHSGCHFTKADPNTCPCFSNFSFILNRRFNILSPSLNLSLDNLGLTLLCSICKHISCSFVEGAPANNVTMTDVYRFLIYAYCWANNKLDNQLPILQLSPLPLLVTSTLSIYLSPSDFCLG